MLTEFVVTTALDETVDNEVLSLREAINAANANEGADTITFDSGLSGQTFALTQSQLEITDTVTITGLGALDTVIDAQGNSRVFNITSTAGDVTLDSLTVTQGLTEVEDAAGAGIRYLASGTLTLIDSAVTVNATTGLNSQGAGIAANSGNVLLIGSTVSGNSTSGANAPGGGIATGTGDITIINSTISSNATGNNNSGGGGISTFSGDITLTNATVAFNLTSGSSSPGGGIFSNGASGTLVIDNSIVAENSSTSATSEDISKSAVQADHSLIGVNSGTDLDPAPVGSPDGNGNLVGTSASPIDPQLAALANNGGSTQTHRLQNNSPAIDGGDNALAEDENGSPLTTDQAGQSRIFHSTVDMGAFELQSTSSSATVAFSVASQTVDEDDGVITLTINLTGVVASDVTLPFTVTGSAANGTDYTISSSPVTISAGSSSATIQLTITDDDDPESNESVIVALGEPTNASLGSPAAQTVTITDNDGGGNGAPTDITLTPGDVNENAANFVVGTLTAIDPNQGDTATFAIRPGGQGNLFKIDGNQLRVGETALNFESLPGGVATVTVRATDSTGLTFDKVVTVTVNDVNEAPSVTIGQSFSVQANAGENDVVGSVVATDPDINAPNNTLSYSIESGNTGDAFAINSATGQITVLNPEVLDPSTKPQYSLVVRATDAGNPALSDASLVVIDVETVNQAPNIPSGQQFTITENPSDNQVVGTVTASDPDPSPPNNALTYSIAGGNTGNAFAINSTTGQITVNDPSAVDFETNPQFTLQIRVTDGGSPALSTTGNVTLIVTDANDPPTVPANQELSISEDAAVGAVVGTVTATDQDATAPNNQITNYAIISGNTGNSFAINPATGQITVLSTANLDSETNPSFELSVRVSDGGGLSTTQTVTVNVTNVNEAPTLENSGEPPVYVAKGPKVVILPNIVVNDLDSNTDLGQIIISLPVPEGQKNPDKLRLKGRAKIGKLSATTSNGRRELTITIKSGTTNAEVQNFLRKITFSTKKEGLNLNHRDIQVQVVDRQGAASNIITQDIGVQTA